MSKPYDSDSSADPPPARDALIADSMLLSLVPGVGPRIAEALLERFGSPTGILDAAPSDLRSTPGVGVKLARNISLARETIDFADEMQAMKSANIAAVLKSDERYPRILQEIPDPPLLLYMKGELIPADALAISIVGTRHATPYGLRTASRLSASLARAGFTIISGLARGIDAAAHRGALEAGGRTIAVLGGGILNLYPPEHRELASDVIANGALLSESPPRQSPTTGSFPRRNRIVTGMSLGVIVIEAADRSGALISARHAMEQNRTVFAVPGQIDSRASRGCHRLIRDGARLIESVDDVLEELGPLVDPVADDEGRTLHHPAELQLNEQELAILNAIGNDPTQIDAIVSACGLPIPRVLATISVLEMRNLVRRISGQLVVRK